MIDEDRDWLDDRLALNNYVVDDGFTAAVVDRLPKSLPGTVRAFRWRILFASTCLATCVAFALVLSEIGTLIQGFQKLPSLYAQAEGMTRIGALLQQPTFLYGGAGCIVLLGFVAIPFLRRWV